MLEISGLRVSYGEAEAVRSVDLRVDDNEVVALLGPNGAGKTSLLRAVCRLVASKGQATFDGQSLAGLSTDAVARLGLVMVPEGRRIFPTLTVQENLLVGRSARCGRPAEFEIDDAYDLFPQLKALRTRHGRALSGGEQQMVAVGRALLSAPRFLLLDEPSLGLSPRITAAVFEALAEVGRRVGMLVVEQNTVGALELCARGYVLVDGQVVLSGTRHELQARNDMMAVYLQGGRIEEAGTS